MNTASNSEFSIGRRILHWLPAIVWMACIFSASTGAMSAAHTSLFVEPFLRWLIPGISQQKLDSLHFLIRKGAHLSEYALLAIFLRHALRRTPVLFGGRGYWKPMGVALILAALYAALDEIHQAFVPSRIGSVVDVLIDTGGAICGLVALYVVDALGEPRSRD